MLDLYAREWEGKALTDDEFVISADEKTSIQARRRKHATDKCRPGTPMRVEHEYTGCGAWAYIAGLDVHHARIFGRCETKNGIDPFDRLVEQVMTRPPYNDARRVFWIVDNCSAHRGLRAVQPLRNRYSQLTLVHAPIHASWLHQIEIYFSIVQRKVLTPDHFPDLNSVAQRLLNFRYYWEDKAKPFEWKFTRKDLAELLGKIGNPCCPQEPLIWLRFCKSTTVLLSWQKKILFSEALYKRVPRLDQDLLTPLRVRTNAGHHRHFQPPKLVLPTMNR